MGRKSKEQIEVERRMAELLTNAEVNVGNLIVKDGILMMYYSPEKRYRSWTDIVQEHGLTNYWHEETEDYDDECFALDTLSGECGIDYSTEVELFEIQDNGNYRIIMTVCGHTCNFHRKWDIIMSSNGHILNKIKLNKDNTVDTNYVEEGDDMN